MNASGFYMSLVECLNCAQHGLSVYPASGASVRYLLISQCVFDSCSQNGVYLSPGSGTVFDTQFNGCWFASNGQSGVEIGTNTTLMTGCKITNNSKHGVFVTSTAQHLVATGNQIVANNMSDTSCHGVYVAPGAQDFAINSNQIGIGSHYGFNRQNYGIFMDAVTNTHYIVRNNLVVGNVLGGVYDGGQTMQKSVGDNIA